MQLGFPPLIIRNKEKQKYYRAFKEYEAGDKQKVEAMEKIFSLALLESLNKRNAYLRGDVIVKLSDYAKKQNESLSLFINKAKRQTISAFREKGVWKIGERKDNAIL